jgi:hypothetical protein
MPTGSATTFHDTFAARLRHHCGMALYRYLLGGREAVSLENFLRLFEKLKGCPATPAEIEELRQQHDRKVVPTTRGRPASGPLGGFGLGGITTKGPKRR